jgi:hypothetical protein
MRTIRGVLVVCGVVSAGIPGVADAAPGFAEPPQGSACLADEAPAEPQEPEPQRLEMPDGGDTMVRIGVGPVLRVSGPVTDTGLGAAVDVGTGAVGVRFAGTWVRVGNDAGLAEYRAELWADFHDGGRVHPIVAAGAGLARLAPDATDTESYGVGVVRGTLEYVLPVVRADARAALDLSGHVPAMHGQNAPDAEPWLLIGARVGVGF